MNVSDDDYSVQILFCVLNGASVLVCLLAAIMVFALKLHSKIVYRLALYQVLSALAFSTVQTLEIIFLNYEKSPVVYGRLCNTIGWLVMYTQWMKLLFTAWLTVHLFCFGVLYKNLKKLEILYVVTSLLVPIIFATVPIITRSYHIDRLGCYISDANGTNPDAGIELFVLWAIPALVILLAASIAMVIMVMKMAYRVCLRLKIEAITDGDQYWKAFKQLLPLATFPILYFLFVIPVLVYYVYAEESSTSNKGVILAASIFIAMWGISSGMALLVHILLVRLYCARRKPLQEHIEIRENVTKYNSCAHPTINESFDSVSSTTRFSPPKDSLDDDDDDGNK